MNSCVTRPVQKALPRTVYLCVPAARPVLRFAITVMTLLAATVFGSSTARALEVLVKEEASVRSDVILLGDIASFDPVGDELVERLKGVEIGASPAPGRTVSLSNRFLIYRIGPAASSMDGVKFKIPENLLLHREAQTVGKRKLKAIFKDYVLKNSKTSKINFEQITVPGAVLLPCGDLSWEVKNRSDGFVGDVSVVVSFIVDGKLVRKLPLTGRISVNQEVIKAARKIRVGEVIGSEDVTTVAESDIRVRENLPNDMNQVLGKRAARTLQAGQLITDRMIEEPPLVQKGEKVVIQAENTRIRISTFGRALQDGREGEQVKVVNMSSGKEIYATVDSPGHVSVAF